LDQRAARYRYFGDRPWLNACGDFQVLGLVTARREIGGLDSHSVSHTEPAVWKVKGAGSVSPAWNEAASTIQHVCWPLAGSGNSNDDVF